jgi:SAM-dependent methyltransferase
VNDWWQTFFDAEYARLWESWTDAARTEQEIAGLWKLLELRDGSRVLDAPCGYGRISLGLARRGAVVLGVDFSEQLLSEAQRARGDVPAERLEYRRHDLREPLPESGFDVALNIFSSLGYGSEADDVAILSTLRNAVRPGGRVFIETNHRDQGVIFFSQARRPTYRLSDGTLFMEEPRFDAVSGRVDSTWYWEGPANRGQKRSSLRLYSATELVALLPRAGLRLLSVHGGCTPEPFRSAGPSMSARLGVLSIRD